MNDRPRVLQIFNRYRESGGEETIIRNLSGPLAEIACLRNCFFESRDWLEPGAPPRWKQALWTVYNPRSAARALAEHATHRAGVWLCHNMFPIASPSIYHAAARRRIPVIQHVQNYRPFSITGSYWGGHAPLGPKLKAMLYREALRCRWNGSIVAGLVMATAMRLLVASGWLRNVRAWIGVSRAVCDRLIEAGVPADRVHHIPPVWEFDPSLEPQSYDGGFLYLGRLIPEKGIDTLLAAWGMLWDQHGSDAPPLHVCGSGPLEARVRDAMGDNPLIRYHGVVDGADKRTLLATCTAVVVPSQWWDPNPTVVGEAFNFSKPVIATAIGGLTDSVMHNINGWLIDPGDCGALARAADRAFRSTADARNRGLSGREQLRRLAKPRLWQRRMSELFDLLRDGNRA